jgi:hypothetical protein
MTSVNKEKDQPRRVGEVIEYHATQCPLVTLSRDWPRVKLSSVVFQSSHDRGATRGIE